MAHVAQTLTDLAQALALHSSGDCGSPRVSGSTSERRSSIRLVSVSLSRLRPPPGRRTRSSAGVSPARNSAKPPDRAARNARDARHGAHPAATGRRCLSRRKTPPPALIKHWSERLEPQPNRRFINHTNPI
jgi:hypothetical protein